MMYTIGWPGPAGGDASADSAGRLHRFGAGVDSSALHAVDLEVHGPRIAAFVVRGAFANVFSVCGAQVRYVRAFGGFGGLEDQQRRCERCGWVVALERGTVAQEINRYAGSGDQGLLRQIFVAILADLPPGSDAAVASHRSDLLAHAARHQPVSLDCAQCAAGLAPDAVHGPGVRACPAAALVCRACTFTAGSWAGGAGYGTATGECVVAAPCSVLVALAEHYGIGLDGLRGGAVMANNPRWAQVGSAANEARANAAAHRQVIAAQAALEVLGARPAVGPHVQRWTQVLQRRVDNPAMTLAELGQSMVPPLSKDAYAAVLRRALRGAGQGFEGGRS